MTEAEFEEMLNDIESIRRAVRRNNPVLRQVLASRGYAAFSLVYGLAIAAVCIPTQLFLDRSGSLAAVPAAWRTLCWIALVLLVPAAGIVKWRIFSRRIEGTDGSNYLALIKAFYGGAWFHINVPIVFAAAGGSAFAIYAGQAWYALPICSVCFALLFNSIGTVLQRNDYLVAGWFAFVSGLVSLFFVASAPFLWIAIVFGGLCVVFGLGGLLFYPRGGRE
jgi:hypothetical protein